MAEFKIQGGLKLQGEVEVSGAKNATLPILAATLLTEEKSTLNNVPDISDVHSFLEIMESLGAEITFKNGTVTVDPAKLKPASLENKLIKQMRASILLLGPLLARFNEAQLAFPGGCVLGKRSVHAHIHALSGLGAELVENTEMIHLKTDGLKAAKVIMAEASVTATENAIMAAVAASGTTEIRWAAMEPHVQDLCNMLVDMGAKIEGIGTHTLVIQGGEELHGANHTIIPDYLEAGTLALAAVLTNGSVKLKNCPTEQLDSFWQKLEEVGAKFTLHKDSVEIHEHNGLHAIEQLKTAVYPGFATDLQAPFVVLLTQCQGVSKVHETLFEGRLNYLEELKRMGANAELQNPQQAIIKGPAPLRASTVKSCDIRAGAAVVLAALIADGESTVTDIVYIERGYEKLGEKLRSLGAKIERIQE